MEYFSPKVRKGIESKSKTISRSGFVLSIAKVSFFGIIFSRLVYLQLFKSKDFKQLSDRNRYREIKEVPERVTIYDFKQRVIASNNQVYQLSIFPKEIKNFFPMLEAQVLVMGESQSSGALLRGVSGESLKTLEIIQKNIIAGNINSLDPGEAVIGSRLASSLGLSEGDNLTLLSP